MIKSRPILSCSSAYLSEAILSRVLIIEGFDMVGKSAVERVLDNHRSKYYPDYSMFDAMVPRSESYIIGVSIMDYLSQVSDRRVLLNRSAYTGDVYKVVYGSGSTTMTKEAIMKYTNKIRSSDGVVVHVSHSGKESAKRIYDSSKSDGNHNDDLDKFSSFEEYWDTYTRAEDEYSKIYKEVGLEDSDDLIRLYTYQYDNGDIELGSDVKEY